MVTLLIVMVCVVIITDIVFGTLHEPRVDRAERARLAQLPITKEYL